jgi:putative FmdB family regulatory protein
MPVYEYGCEAGHRFEVKQKFSDAPVTSCQICSLPVTKLISASGISFKGSGWYVTDYSDKMKQPTTSEKSPSSSGAQNDSSTPKSDAKTLTPSSPPASSSPTPSTPSNGGSSGSGSSSPSPSGS